MRLDEYRRVSQVAGREGDGFQSPELQAKAIAAYAGIHGHAVTPNAPELDVSGSKLKRPILDKIIARIRGDESDGIIVNDLDRYSRDVLGANLLLVEIKQAGGTLVSVHENIDITTPDGKMMFDFRMAIAENYLATSRARAKVGRSAAARRREGHLHRELRPAGTGKARRPAQVKRKGKKHIIPVYRCRRVHARGRCSEPSSITRKSIEPYVEDAFRSEMAGTSFTAAQTDTKIAQAQERLAALEAELAKFAADTTVREALGEAAYHAAIQSRAQGVTNVRDTLRSFASNTVTLEGIETRDSLSVERASKDSRGRDRCRLYPSRLRGR